MLTPIWIEPYTGEFEMFYNMYKIKIHIQSTFNAFCKKNNNITKYLFFERLQHVNVL